MIRLRRRIITYLAGCFLISSVSSLIWLMMVETESNTTFPNFPATRSLLRRSDLWIQTRFDCNKLFIGDSEEIKFVQDYLKNRNGTFAGSDRPDVMTLDCDAYIESRRYITQSYEGEDKFPIAFNILFHKNFEQLERLLRAIYRSQHQFCIHVDRKTPHNVFEHILALAACFDNVFVASKREIMVYEGYTRLIADMDCMEDHIARNTKWEYLINMAASEFPLLTNIQIVQVLIGLGGNNEIESVLNHTNDIRYKYKHFTYFFPGTNEGRMIHTRERKKGPPHGLTITKGNAYGIFNRAFVEFLLNDNISRDLLKWLEDTSVSEEHYWATLNNLYNNPFLKTPGGYRGPPDIKPYFARFIAWNRDSQKEHCLDKHYIHNICVFSFRDLPVLKDRHELIANKFDLEYDPIVYECMEELLYNKTVQREALTNLGLYNQF